MGCSCVGTDPDNRPQQSSQGRRGRGLTQPSTECHLFSIPETWLRGLGSSLGLTGCVALGKSLMLSGLQSLYLYNDLPGVCLLAVHSLVMTAPPSGWPHGSPTVSACPQTEAPMRSGNRAEWSPSHPEEE